MKKTLLALACAAMATASIQAESVEIVRSNWQYPTNNMNTTRKLASGSAFDAGFAATFSGNVDTTNDTYYLWNNSGTAMKYLVLTANSQGYIIDSIDIEFGNTTNTYDVLVQVRTSDTAYTTANAATAGEEMMQIPYLPGETMNVPIDNKFFSIVDITTASANGSVGNKVDIAKLTINYSAGAPKNDPSWTLVNPGDGMVSGSTFTPEVENNVENLPINYTLKFGTLEIKPNADGSYNLGYAGTWTLTATSAVTNEYNAKSETVTFVTSTKEAQWEVEEPTGLKLGDTWKPVMKYAVEDNLEFELKVEFGSTTLTPDADGYYTFNEVGTYTVTATSKAGEGYAGKTQKFSIVIADSSVGVEAIETAAEATYYTLQGLAVKDLTPGLYIMKQGNKVSKVIVR